ncbi:MAG: endonuclease domain-containing protein, partial [Xanthomonadaceae bacterium]|nr:endonuclease domain-containing protein [Xanthomonadaceae bacterium]
MRHKPPLPTQTLASAKSLRTTSTDAECKLWYHLRARRLGGFKFRRQHPIPPYVADFYCDRLNLVIELDGSQHNEESDLTRTLALQRQGLFVLRFWDNQVLQETEAVLEAILDFA